MLRGSRDFEDQENYERFLRELLAQRNSGRTERFGEDRSELRGLPARRVDAWRRCPAQVTQGSTIRIGYNTYSVPSRLIGEKVDVPIKVECLEVWHGSVLVERVPRLRGRNQHEINYRHVIDWLVRKPGAFAGYRYQDAMFPTSRFRRAYDALLERSPGRAAKDYYPGSKEGHIPTRSASEGSGAFPSLARRVNMQQHAELPCRGNTCGSSSWRPSNPRPGSTPCWAGSWSGMYLTVTDFGGGNLMLT